MSENERRAGVDGPGGGERSEPGPGPSGGQQLTRGRQGSAAAKRHRHYTPEERRAAIEAQEKSGLSVEEFARTFGISAVTFQRTLA